jgi:hypothetical protein
MDFIRGQRALYTNNEKFYDETIKGVFLPGIKKQTG